LLYKGRRNDGSTQRGQAMSFSENHKLQFAIDNACKKLPQEYTIHICIEQGSATVKLYNIVGDECDYIINDSAIAELINDAVDFAEARQ
jgi:hypothetical protein